MDRATAVKMWREVCGSEEIAGLPPTGRLLEAFAARVQAAEREACARFVENDCAYTDWNEDGRFCAESMRAR